MGNSASKAASKAKQAAPTRIPAFGQRPISEQIQEARGQPVEPLPKASESKSDAIRRDAEDPTFAANLASLGQVSVPGKGQAAFRTDNPMLNILASRQQAEEAAEQFGAGSKTNIRNQISARTLSLLLDERKDVKTKEEYVELCREYGMEANVVEGLARYINSPSISGIDLPIKDPNETPKKLAIWVDPPFAKLAQLADK
ncbi:hypothetical protein JCM6882_006651 [Rhodosporidiobolus microsporus]